MKNKAEGSDEEGGSGSARRAKGSETPVDVLPREIVLQMVKDRLARQSDEMGCKDEVVENEVLLAFTESTCAFINYVCARAMDLCKQSGKTVVDADHVLDALKSISFPQFVPDLEAALEAFKEKNAGETCEEKATTDECQKQDEQSSKDGKDVGEESSEGNSCP
ncbi:Histone-like transcription factor (CBF/NF-Y) and archaeal histone [Musa troglodytarum]|uniref:Histone-like transcription factor (CBF/NF-Y) and archaeal histone n=1 Tax=Musa troglodytarum TaxID=320322 RepID=A0A9E7E7R5_9LILI|nr:Histone-like transcription factor (CBF/NF-Y) and archaeal histone [Musa troglodytarum]